MSAQVIDFPQLEARQLPMNDVARIAVPEKENLLVSHLPLDFLHGVLLYAPHPTQEDLLRESFLLDCD